MTKSKLNQLLQIIPYLLGLGLIFVGIAGFLPNGHTILGVHAHQITNQHNFIHLLTGLGLIFVTFTKSQFARIYLTLMAILYVILATLGIILNGNIFNTVFAETLDHVLHFGIAILCIWFAYFPPFTNKITSKS
jgi:hypothetical protein